MQTLLRLKSSPGRAYACIELTSLPPSARSPTQQDHARLNAYLSMSAYGDFRKTCPGTFPKGFTVLQEFNVPVPGMNVGQSGYIAKVPDMEKVNCTGIQRYVGSV